MEKNACIKYFIICAVNLIKISNCEMNRTSTRRMCLIEYNIT